MSGEGDPNVTTEDGHNCCALAEFTIKNTMIILLLAVIKGK